MRLGWLALAGVLAAPALFAAAPKIEELKNAPTPSPRVTVWPTPTLPLPLSVAMIDGKPATIDKIPFGAGETLTLTASWAGISVGDATMTVETGATFDGKPAIHLKGTAKSNRTFSMFFSIKDASESWIDPKELFSLGFLSDQSESNNADYQRYVLDYEHGLAHRYRVHYDKDGKLDVYGIDLALTKAKVQDAASMLYFFRAFDLKPGQTLTSDVYVSKEMWTLKAAAVGEEKGVKVPAGTFDCVKIEPRVEQNGTPQNKGKMTVWISEDEKRVPVKIVSEVPLGKVNAVLSSYTQGAKAPKQEK